MNTSPLQPSPLLVAAGVFIIALLPTAIATSRLHRLAWERDLQRFNAEVTKPLLNLRFVTIRARDYLTTLASEFDRTPPHASFHNSESVHDWRQRDRHLVALYRAEWRGDNLSI